MNCVGETLSKIFNPGRLFYILVHAWITSLLLEPAGMSAPQKSHRLRMREKSVPNGKKNLFPEEDRIDGGHSKLH